MQATRRDPLKEARETITCAALFTLTVTGPATLIAGIILIAVSHSEWLASIAFVSIFIADLLGMLWWSRRRSAPPIEEQQITVHAFVSHVKMHPEVLPEGMTEFDLERFRKQWDGGSQMTLKAWIKQFSGETTPTSSVNAWCQMLNPGLALEKGTSDESVPTVLEWKCRCSCD